jgi:hypothetical protein
MRIRLLLLLVLFGLTPYMVPEASAAFHPATEGHTYHPLKSVTPKTYRQLTGRKMSLKDRIGLAILKWKSKLSIEDGEPTQKQLKQGRLSLIFGASAILLAFIPYVGIVSIPLAVAGLILGIKSLKGNSNTPGILGVVFSGLVLFIIVLAVILIGIYATGMY